MLPLAEFVRIAALEICLNYWGKWGNRSKINEHWLSPIRWFYTSLMQATSWPQNQLPRANSARMGRFIFLGLQSLEIWKMELTILEVGHETGLATPTVSKSIDFAIPENRRYSLPVGRVHDDWSGCKLESFIPTDRQKLVIEAVKSALDSKLHYNNDVLKYCIESLGVTPEQGKVGAIRVEGGDVGMDCYYARDYLRHMHERAAERRSLAMLKPFIGQVLGTLVFSDFKRNTGMTVKEMGDDLRTLTLKGKRGRYTVELICTARQIENAMNRAFENKLRKDTFDQVFKLNDNEALAIAVTEVMGS